MIDFLQDYGIWILFGFLFLLMLRGRGRGIGCGMGDHREHHGEDSKGSPGRQGDGGSHHSAGCH